METAEESLEGESGTNSPHDANADHPLQWFCSLVHCVRATEANHFPAKANVDPRPLHGSGQALHLIRPSEEGKAPAKPATMLRCQPMFLNTDGCLELQDGENCGPEARQHRNAAR